jgi:hypothetical protein
MLHLLTCRGGASPQSDSAAEKREKAHVHFKAGEGLQEMKKYPKASKKYE